jgi:hypothetical protein
MKFKQNLNLLSCVKKCLFLNLIFFHQLFLYTLLCFHLEKTKDAKALPSYTFKSSVETTRDNKLEVTLEDKVYLETY